MSPRTDLRIFKSYSKVMKQCSLISSRSNVTWLCLLVTISFLAQVHVARSQDGVVTSVKVSYPQVDQTLSDLSPAIAHSNCELLSEVCSPPHYEVWEVNSRALGCTPCRPIHWESRLAVSQFHPETGWHRSELSELTGRDFPLTILYVHGNWMETWNARCRVRLIANYVARQTDTPFRIVMFSWPSQKQGRPIKDIIENTKCCDVQAFYFGCLIRKFRDHSPLSILGFSLGGRIVAGGLHLDAGGSLFGQSLPADCDVVTAKDTVPHYRVSMIAPAIDQTWLRAGQRNGNAMTYVDRLVNLYNSHDPVLKRYFFSDLSNRPLAAGFAGFVGIGEPRPSEPLASQDRVVQYDCYPSLGNTHDERSYYRQCPKCTSAIQNLLWQD